MNQKQEMFKYGDAEIRVVTVNGQPWWVAKDVCSVLEISNPSDVLKRLDDDERARFNLGRQGKTNVVSESGLYSLILGSRKPEAKKFKRWITHEVIPSIRKTGQYVAVESVPSYMIDNPIDRAKKWIEEYEEKEKLQTANLMLEQVVSEYTPKVTYYDTILSAKDAILIRQIASDYDLTAQELNKILHNEKVQHKQGNQWLLYKDHHHKGYTKSETYTYRDKYGKEQVSISTKWTQKGRLFIHNLLDSLGIKPVMDKEIESVTG
ncbi:Phage antirepressor protein KilAC domain protein [compost metagenome]